MLDNTVLLGRYEKEISSIENILVEGINSPQLTRNKKLTIARLLENFNAGLRSNTAGVGPTRLLESAGTGLADIGPYTKFGINLITAVMSNVVADTIVSVQPMTSRVGEVRYLAYKYASNKGDVTEGTLVSSALEFSGGKFDYTLETVSGETVAASGSTTISGNFAWTPVQPGSVSLVVDDVTITDDGEGNLVGDSVSTGTINYTTGAYAITFSAAQTADGTLAYKYTNTGVEPQVPEITTEIEILAMKAESRKLKTAYSFDAAFDLQGDYGFNIDAETVAFFSAEIAHEIDGEIMRDLYNLAVSNSDTISAWSAVAPTGVSQQQHDDSFWNKVVEGGNVIFKRLLRGRASFIIAGVDVCSTIETMTAFKPSNFDASGPHIVGTLKGVPVIKNPFYVSTDYVVGYKGANLFDTGYIYAPYMPVTVIDMVKQDNFTFGKGFATAYGKAMINAKCYAKGSITLS